MLEHFKFWLLYRIGFTPWDGHARAHKLTSLVEGAEKLPPARALDLGCGTGDASIYLAQHGWDVTGIDFLEKPLVRAREKAAAAGVRVRWIHGDVTRLSSSSVGGGFALVVDNGCFHGLDDAAREAYAREVTAATTPEAHLVIAGFLPGKRGPGPRGFDRAELERRFTAWELASVDKDPGASARGEADPIHVYHLRRR